MSLYIIFYVVYEQVAHIPNDTSYERRVEIRRGEAGEARLHIVVRCVCVVEVDQESRDKNRLETVVSSMEIRIGCIVKYRTIL